jgi:hypothetical protein
MAGGGSCIRSACSEEEQRIVVSVLEVLCGQGTSASSNFSFVSYTVALPFNDELHASCHSCSFSNLDWRSEAVLSLFVCVFYANSELQYCISHDDENNPQH